MLGNALVEGNDWSAFRRTYQSEWDFVSRGKVSPAQVLLVQVVETRVVPEGHLLSRLRIAEGVTKDDLFSFQLGGDIDPRSSLAVCAPK